MARDAYEIDPKKAGRVVVVGVVVVFFLILAFGHKPLAIGDVVPDVEGEAVGGSVFSLAAWRGRPVFVTVWATWCGPCLAEMPALVAAAQKHPEVGFVGLAADSPRADVDKVVAQQGVTFPIVMVGDSDTVAWGVKGFPSNFLVGADGALLWAGGNV